LGKRDIKPYANGVQAAVTNDNDEIGGLNVLDLGAL